LEQKDINQICYLMVWQRAVIVTTLIALTTQEPLTSLIRPSQHLHQLHTVHPPSQQHNQSIYRNTCHPQDIMDCSSRPGPQCRTLLGD